MHRACKTRPGWAPTLAEDEEGMLTSSPQVVLKREVDTLSSFWKAEHWAEPAWVPQDRQPLPRMSARNLKEVALTFPATHECHASNGNCISDSKDSQSHNLFHTHPIRGLSCWAGPQSKAKVSIA